MKSFLAFVLLFVIAGAMSAQQAFTSESGNVNFATHVAGNEPPTAMIHEATDDPAREPEAAQSAPAPYTPKHHTHDRLAIALVAAALVGLIVALVVSMRHSS